MTFTENERGWALFAYADIRVHLGKIKVWMAGILPTGSRSVPTDRRRSTQLCANLERVSFFHFRAGHHRVGSPRQPQVCLLGESWADSLGMIHGRHSTVAHSDREELSGVMNFDPPSWLSLSVRGASRLKSTIQHRAGQDGNTGPRPKWNAAAGSTCCCP